MLPFAIACIAFLCICHTFRRLGRAPLRCNGDRALIVVAHPDDESLFFSNYIKHAISTGMDVHILCLSTGNADGLGHIRSQEMRRACATLQISQSRLVVVDDPDLQDGFHAWSIQAITRYLNAAVHSIQPCELVTFDLCGVSGHPNHISIFHAVRYMVMETGSGWKGGGEGEFCVDGVSSAIGSGGTRCRVYTLVTHPLPLKFCGPLGVVLILLLEWAAAVLARLPFSRCDGARDQLMLTRDPTLCFRALICHWSQFVWYRLLFVLFSTYTYANQLHLVGTLTVHRGANCAQRS